MFPLVAARKAVVAWVVVLALFSAVGAGCGTGSSPEVEVGPDGTPDPVLVDGRGVFVDRCASCHDADGSGPATVPP